MSDTFDVVEPEASSILLSSGGNQTALHVRWPVLISASGEEHSLPWGSDRGRRRRPIQHMEFH